MHKPTSRPMVDMVAMHRYCRPAGTITETRFIREYISPLPGCTPDDYHNLHVVVGGNTRVLWSCHTDTVHRRQGMQKVHIDKYGVLSTRANSGCLGADDTAGVWLCRELILAGVPGHYVFHYGEEKGCIGSSDIAEHAPHLLCDAQYAIAFDRKGTSDIITHQCGVRTCSDAFANGLAGLLNTAIPTFRYAPSDRGIYTDTEQYKTLIPECTNIAVGYDSQHSNSETLSSRHLLRLRDALITFGHEVQTLPIDRDHTVEDDKWTDDLTFHHWRNSGRYEPTTFTPVTLNTRYLLRYNCEDCGLTWDELSHFPDDEDYCQDCWTPVMPWSAEPITF
jgi:hypothetical protein